MANRSLNSLSDLSSEVPFSYLLENSVCHQLQPDLAGVSDSAAQKRGRGRPPKHKPDVQQNGQFPTNLNDVPASVLTEEARPVKRPRGRPRKNGSPVTSQGASMAVDGVKRRGRPPGQRGPGSPRKLKPMSALETVFPITVNGPRKRGRPRKVETGAVAVPAPTETGNAMAPPKMGGVISVSHTGRPRGRPRKDATPAAAEVPREEAADYGALKRKYEFLQERVKEATNKLKAAVSAMEEVQVIAAAFI